MNINSDEINISLNVYAICFEMLSGYKPGTFLDLLSERSTLLELQILEDLQEIHVAPRVSCIQLHSCCDP